MLADFDIFLLIEVFVITYVLAADSSSDPKKDTMPTCQMTTELSHRHQRHSLIGLFTGEGYHGSKSAQSHDLMHSHLKGNVVLM